jgi:hypothetical protein
MIVLCSSLWNNSTPSHVKVGQGFNVSISNRAIDPTQPPLVPLKAPFTIPKFYNPVDGKRGVNASAKKETNLSYC